MGGRQGWGRTGSRGRKGGEYRVFVIIFLMSRNSCSRQKASDNSEISKGRKKNLKSHNLEVSTGCVSFP